MTYTPTLPEIIRRKRRFVLVHSILYYRLNETVISDAKFDEVAHELAAYQQTSPEFCMTVDFYPEEFKDFNGETGYHLPLLDPSCTCMAIWLLQQRNKELEKLKSQPEVPLAERIKALERSRDEVKL